MPLLQGVEISDPELVRVLYHLGDFKYQFPINLFGRYPSRVMTCDSPAERDWLVEQVSYGNVVIIKPPL